MSPPQAWLCVASILISFTVASFGFEVVGGPLWWPDLALTSSRLLSWRSMAATWQLSRYAPLPFLLFCFYLSCFLSVGLPHFVSCFVLLISACLRAMFYLWIPLTIATVAINISTRCESISLASFKKKKKQPSTLLPLMNKILLVICQLYISLEWNFTLTRICSASRLI